MLPLPLRRVDDINPGFWTAAGGWGGGDRETVLSNLFFHDVNVAAGGHVDLNLTPPTDLVLLAKEE